MRVSLNGLIGASCLAIALATGVHLQPGMAGNSETVKVSAKRFSFTPTEITLKKNVPVTFELTTEDRSHGFAIEGTKVRATIEPGKTTNLQFTPTKAGTYNFYCDVFCGSGHDNMAGKLKVVD